MTIEEKYDVTLTYEPHNRDAELVVITVEHNGHERTIYRHRSNRCVRAKNGPFFYSYEHYTLGNGLHEYKTLGGAVRAAFPRARIE